MLDHFNATRGRAFGKGTKILIFVFFIFCLLMVFNWLTSSDKLKPDGLNLFKNEEALNERFPFAKYVYIGHFSQPFPSSTYRKDSQYFFKLSFKSEIPINVFVKNFKRIESEEGNNGDSIKSFQKLVNKTRASVKMRIPIVCVENANDKSEFLTNFLKKDFNNILIDLFKKTVVEFDIIDNHKFIIKQTGVSNFSDSISFEFDNDFKTCKMINLKSPNSQSNNLIGELKRVDLYNQFDLAGYYHINFKLVSLGLGMMVEDTYVNENQLYFTGLVFFKPSVNFRVGKIYIRGNSYDLIGYKDGDFYRLFAGNNHYIQLRKKLKSTSYLAPDFKKFILDTDNTVSVYLTDISKASLPDGKEKEMLTNFDKLGNALGSDKYNPESWTYYEEIAPHLSNFEEVIKDDDLFKVFQNSTWLKSYIQSHYNLRDIGYVFGSNYNPQKVREIILSRLLGVDSIKMPGKSSEKKKKRNNLSDIMGD